MHSMNNIFESETLGLPQEKCLSNNRMDTFAEHDNNLEVLNAVHIVHFTISWNYDQDDIVIAEDIFLVI